MILEKMPDDASQTHGIDYDTQLIERVAKADPEARPQQMTLDDWQAGRKNSRRNSTSCAAEWSGTCARMTTR